MILALDSNNIALIAANQIILFPDYGVTDPEGVDEDNQPIGGLRCLFINSNNTLIQVESLPDPWVQCAYLWDGTKLVLQENSTAYQDYIAANKPSVPNSVSPRQIRQALTKAGMRQDVEDAVNSSTQDVQDAYHYATEFRRDSQVVAQLAAKMNVTSDQLDDLWISASEL